MMWYTSLEEEEVKEERRGEEEQEEQDVGWRGEVRKGKRSKMKREGEEGDTAQGDEGLDGYIPEWVMRQRGASAAR